MTIATNNGVPIIRDGKVVTSCSCCGGWSCRSRFCDGLECLLRSNTAWVIRANIQGNSFQYAFVSFAPNNPLTQPTTFGGSPRPNYVLTHSISTSSVSVSGEFTTNNPPFSIDPLTSYYTLTNGLVSASAINFRIKSFSASSSCEGFRETHSMSMIAELEGGGWSVSGFAERVGSEQSLIGSGQGPYTSFSVSGISWLTYNDERGRVETPLDVSFSHPGGLFN